MNLDVTYYQPEIDLAIAKYAKGVQPADVEDLTQECYLSLLRAHRLTELSEGDAKRYAYIVARNRILNLLQRKKFSIRLPPISKINHELRQAIADLPNEQFDVIWLRYWYGLSEEDISRILRRSLEWVRIRRNGALITLRRTLKGHYDNLAVVQVPDLRTSARQSRSFARRGVEEVRHAA